jgi:hypothetical protein
MLCPVEVSEASTIAIAIANASRFDDTVHSCEIGTLATFATGKPASGRGYNTGAFAGSRSQSYNFASGSRSQSHNFAAGSRSQSDIFTARSRSQSHNFTVSSSELDFPSSDTDADGIIGEDGMAAGGVYRMMDDTDTGV